MNARIDAGHAVVTLGLSFAAVVAGVAAMPWLGVTRLDVTMLTTMYALTMTGVAVGFHLHSPWVGAAGKSHQGWRGFWHAHVGWIFDISGWLILSLAYVGLVDDVRVRTCEQRQAARVDARALNGSPS
jgi:hypothetical protein